jgi:hypothetical protein
VIGASTAAAEASFAMEREAVVLRRLALVSIVQVGEVKSERRAWVGSEKLEERGVLAKPP